MTCRRVFSAVLSILVMVSVVSAQQPDAMIMFGGLRVPACAVSADPAYGLTAAKPIQIGGGPVNANARLNRYVSALRGPNGETLRIAPGRGSLPAPLGYMDEPTILDAYQIEFGDQKMSLYVDDYHFGIPKAPMGLTCVGNLVGTLGPPPVDPMLLNRSMVSLAIQEGSLRDIPGVPLDVSTPRGFLFDQFAMISQRARAAANAGMPLDPKKPPSDIDPTGLVVLAFPVPCGGKTLIPQRIEVSGPQGPIPQNGVLIKDEPLVKMFPSLTVPFGSVAARFRQSQVSGFKIVYPEGCDATPAEVSLLVRVEAPRPPQLRPLALPAGVVEPEPAVYLQVILDPAGEFGSIVYIGGPKSLVPAAIEEVRKLRSAPVRLNGVAIANPALIPIVFQ